MLDIIRAAAEDNLVNGRLAAYLYCLRYWGEPGRWPKGEEVPEGVRKAPSGFSLPTRPPAPA